jgi:3-oxoacyl-[acyl-carrier protein] reductase
MADSYTSRPLRGRVALITGVSRRAGIGFAIARQLGQIGADLFIHSFTPFDQAAPWGADTGGMEAVLAGLRQTKGRVAHLEADLMLPESARRVIDAAVAEFGHIDILIANHAHGLTGSLETLTAESIDAALVVNVRATLLLIKHFVAQHDGRAGGRVVMMTSGQHRGPMPTELAYVASKGAIHQLTRSLSDHLVRRGITVNTVNPGATDTGWADNATRRRVLEREPQGCWGMPEDAARLIAWLVSDDAQWITGEVINSTGGGD